MPLVTVNQTHFEYILREATGQREVVKSKDSSVGATDREDPDYASLGAHHILAR